MPQNCRFLDLEAANGKPVGQGFHFDRRMIREPGLRSEAGLR
ncbi:MAG: hypothetical protein ACK526_09140 [Planctomyces sp.]